MRLCPSNSLPLARTMQMPRHSLDQPNQIARYFDGLDLVDPGLVPIQQWRPDNRQFDPPKNLTNLGGVARKPLSRSPAGVCGPASLQ